MSTKDKEVWRVNWLNSVIIFTPPIAFAYLFWYNSLTLPTFILASFTYWLSGLGITVGYHRLWSHKSFNTHWTVELLLAFFGAAAWEGSAKWWCRNHRAHHRYMDTVRDPYATYRGFWHAHFGWMVWKDKNNKHGKVDINDMNSSKIIQFQHKFYVPLALLFGFVIPIAIAQYFWSDGWGALTYACFGRMILVHNATFCVNSLAHTIGKQSYSEEHSSYDSVITALVTFGEGYHNFHHEFPYDFRNGVEWYHYDPTKWFIAALSFFGLASELKRIPRNEIIKARLQVKELKVKQNLSEGSINQQLLAKIEAEKAKIDWGRKLEDLPTWTWQEVRKKSQSGTVIVVVDSVAHDVTDFLDQHPGGASFLRFWSGRDATKAIQDDVHRHQKAARNLMAFYRVAKVEGPIPIDN